MPCYSCSAEFGILKKEIGCEACGFSFCSRCCKKQQVPSESGESKKLVVCNNCFKELTSEKSKPTSKGSPPLAHKKRMESLKKQSFSVDSSSHSMLESQWSNEIDKNLAERLQKLKRDRVKATLPSESEIEERLAKLKGMDPSKYTAPPIQVFRPVERITSVEQAANLLIQMKEEAALDSRLVKPEDEIAARLAKLRDEPPPVKTEKFNIPPSLAADSSEEMNIDNAYSTFQGESRKLSEMACKEVKELNTNTDYKNLVSSMQQEKETEISDDEEEAEKLVERLLATDINDMEEMDSLNDPDTEKQSSKSSMESTEEEFPWCVICTEDAKIRCFGCEGDLYCMRCFRECHDSLDIKDHKTYPFLPPKVPMM